MGTITRRKRSDGEFSYTAQIRLKQGGKVVHSEAQTFSRRALAVEWMRRREVELEQARASGRALLKGVSVDELIGDYVSAAKGVTDWGRSKQADIKRLRAADLAQVDALQLTVQAVMDYAKARRVEDEAGPATVLNDLIWLRQVFLHAKAVRGLNGPLETLDTARAELLRSRVVAKSRRRERRLKPEEEKLLRAHFAQRDARARIPMLEIMEFALLSSRRQEEICALRWADWDKEKGIAWLDDVKHPRRKRGNRRSFRVLEAAAEVMERQPKTSDRIFPYNSKSVGTAFTRACKFLEIEDLVFHDLRHEATSRLFERGYMIQEVAHFTLHESWETLKRYTHLRPEHVPER